MRSAGLTGGLIAVVAMGALALGYSVLAGGSDPAVDDREGTPARGWLLEATIDVDGADAAAGPGAQAGPTASSIRWAWADEQHWRIEIHRDDTPLGGFETVLLPDDEHVIDYEPFSRTFRRYPLPDAAVDGPYPPPISVQIGPSPADSVDTFIEELERSEDLQAQRSGTEEHLGYSVEVIELRAAGQTQDREAGRVRIDPQTMFVLLNEREPIEGEGVAYRAEVVSLDFDRDLRDPLRFDRSEFEADEVDAELAGQCAAVIVEHGGSAPPVGRDLLQLAGAPGGWVMSTSMTRGAAEGCPAGHAWTRFEPETGAPGAYLVFEQRRFAGEQMPEWLQSDAGVDIDTHEGYHHSDDSVERITWVQDGFVAALESDALTLDELLSVAEAVRSPASSP